MANVTALFYMIGVKMKDLSLYIHIPFCVKKCNYCDFLSASCEEETRQRYVDALCQEIKQQSEMFQDRNVDTVFFGGGTPSILSSGQIGQIMSAVRKGFRILTDAEITLEMNPGTVDKQKLETYKKLGINRLSIGLQSANNEELKVLGRIHTWEEFLQTWEMVREAGFLNVNIDLMSALPGQTPESYEETLRKVLTLKPKHISAYSLIVEEGTPFYEWFGENGKRQRELPDEITDRKMYELTKRMLEERGYYRYEISNYALKGYECKHNIGYWKRKEYLGLGLGAASLISNIRCTNVTDLKKYLIIAEKKFIDEKKETPLERWKSQEVVTEVTELSLEDQMEEFMFLGLRMMEGVSTAEFENCFGKTLSEVYGEAITKLEKQGLLKYSKENRRYVLTAQGIDISNQVFVEFLF